MILPSCNIREFIKEKYPFPLRPCYRLHYPYILVTMLLTELISEYYIFVRKQVGHGKVVVPTYILNYC